MMDCGSCALCFGFGNKKICEAIQDSRWWEKTTTKDQELALMKAIEKGKNHE